MYKSTNKIYLQNGNIILRVYIALKHGRNVWFLNFGPNVSIYSHRHFPQLVALLPATYKQ